MKMHGMHGMMDDEEKDRKGKVLQMIMDDMDKYSFDKKMKPKIMSVEVHGGTEPHPGLKEMMGSKMGMGDGEENDEYGDDDEASEMPGMGGMKSSMMKGMHPQEDDMEEMHGMHSSGLDPRVMALIKKKKMMRG